MSNLDQFESAFRATLRERFSYHRPDCRDVIFITDAEGTELAEFDMAARKFLAVLNQGEVEQRARFSTLPPSDLVSMEGMLEALQKRQPDLIVTHRRLGSRSPGLPYSLGEHIDVLTQIAHPPVLLLPQPGQGKAQIPTNTDRVMAMTDHLAGDGELVNMAARFTEPGGTLFLSHVEDGVSFERFLDAISKVPAIDTETARTSLLERLLKEPSDYAAEAARAIAMGRGGPQSIAVEALITTGHRLTEYRRLVSEHEVDLLVLHTKDHDQIAMHGTAHSLSVELSDTPLLLL
jgi:hypothetical protein